MSNIYENPAGQPANITQINNTYANLVNELNPCQLAISIDTTRNTNPFLVFKDDLGNIFELTSNGEFNHDHSNLMDTLFIVNNKIGIKEANPQHTLSVAGDLGVNNEIICWGNINTSGPIYSMSNSPGLVLRTDTADGSDTKYVLIAGGGNGQGARGGYILCYGNEAGGEVRLVAGDGDGTTSGIINLLSKTIINSGARPTNDYSWDMAFNKYFTIYQNGFDEHYLLSNAYYSGGTWKYRESVANCATKVNLGETGLTVSTASQGTKDAVITWNNAFKVDRNGNVGIGTFNPMTKLQVNGNMRISEDLLVGYSKTGSQSFPSFISVGTSYASSPVREKCKIYLYSDGSTERYGFGVGFESDIQYHSNGRHDFFIANSKKMTITSNGNVGIGTTNPQATLHVNGTIYATGGIQGVDNTKFVASDYPGTYWLTVNSSGSYWHITSNNGAGVRVAYADVAGSVTNATNAVNSDKLDGLHSWSLFNNMGNNHSTFTDFNSINSSGCYFVTSTTNGPGTLNAMQYYVMSLGLGADYESTYRCQIAWPRTPVSSNPNSLPKPTLSVRYKENGTWTDWAKMYVGFADSASYASSCYNADMVDGVHIGNRTNWFDGGGNSSMHAVVGQLGWKYYNGPNGHTIFDASGGVSPAQTGINRDNPEIYWQTTYPTLMGWNGSKTYGVRVDSARSSNIADDANALGTYAANTFLGKFGNTHYQADKYIQFNAAPGMGGIAWPNGTMDSDGIYRSSQLGTNNNYTYGNLKIWGRKNTYAGIVFEDSSVKATLMSPSVGQATGIYQQSNNRWQWYHNGTDLLIGSPDANANLYAAYHKGNLSNGITDKNIPFWTSSDQKLNNSIVYQSSDNTALYIGGNLSLSGGVSSSEIITNRIKMSNTVINHIGPSSSGVDSSSLVLYGGSNYDSGTKGGVISIYGNTNSSNPGEVILTPGLNGSVKLNGFTSVVTGDGVPYNKTGVGVNNPWGLSLSKYFTMTPYGSETYICYNAYYNGSWRFRENGVGATVVNIGSTGFHVATGNTTSGTRDGSLTYNKGFSVDHRGFVGVNTHTPGAALDIRCSARVEEDFLVGWGKSAAQTNPSFISLGSSYYSGAPDKTKCKILLRNDSYYGFGVGGSLDLQYHCGSNYGTHDFFLNNSLCMRSSMYGLVIGNGLSTNITAQQMLDVDGNARFQHIGSGSSWGALHYTLDGTLTSSTSDIRKKKDIKNLENTLDKIMLLNPVTFKWKDNSTESLGLIAQEVEKVFPLVTFTNPTDKFMGIRYELFSSILIKSTQELNNKIKELENENKTLKTTIEEILKRLEKLENNL